MLNDKRNTKAQEYIHQYKVEEIRNNALTANPANQEYLADEALAEVTDVYNFLDDAMSLAYTDSDKVFDMLNSGYALHMHEKANAGLLFRHEIKQELELFIKISNVIRGAMPKQKSPYECNGAL